MAEIRRGDPFAEMDALYRDRRGAAARLKRQGRRVVACMGGDVPEELIMAAGLTPVRLTSDLEAATPLADVYLGGMVDGDHRALLQLVLDGGYGDLDGLVIARDTENLVRVFYTLRALSKTSPETVTKVPPFYFYDLLHMPQRTTGLYNRVRTRELRAKLAAWADVEITDAALRGAIAACNENRALLGQIRQHRIAGAPRLSGAEALKLAVTSRLMAKAQHTALLQTVLEALPNRPALAGKRVFLTGSAHDDTAYYDLIEGCGAVIVGDDHGWGDRGFERLVEEDTSAPLDALVDRYHFAPPVGAKYTVAERAAYTGERAREAKADAVIAIIKNGDPGPRWDVPAQREALGSIPLLLLDDQESRPKEPDTLKATITSFLEAGR
ncbi:MAG: 2-hydroxyacyl-CoA dehydratase family protein [Caulobacteraceae bacterium]